MKHEYFWSVNVEPDWVSSSIWKVQEQKIDIESVSKQMSWEDHNLVEVVDASLSETIGELSEEIKEPSKTVFGVPAFWVEDGKIKDKQLAKIKEICTKLSLSPTGFVVLPEAIAHSSKIKDGNPLTSIVLGVFGNMVDLTIFKLGNLVGTVSVGRSISVFEDIVEGLSRFGLKDPLPSRILIYGGDKKDLEKTKQELVVADWDVLKEKKLNFLHTPQLEIIDSKQKTVAVSVAGASEMGSISEVNVAGGINPISDLSQTEESLNVTEADSNITETKDLSATDVGFVIDEELEEDTEEKQKPKVEIKEAKPLSESKKIKLPDIKFGVSRLKLAIIGVILLLLVGFGSALAAWWFLPNADVTIYISPKQLEEQEAITLDEFIDSPDVENRIFPAKQLSIEVTDSKQKAATGAITIGEKASGSVTIRNGTSDAVLLSSGDILSGPGGLEFEVVESASVSAALSPTEPGEATLEAEAIDIGAEYNLAKDETMSVQGYSKSEVDAIVSTAFTGGTSKEITAVSQADLNALESEVLADLKRKGITEIEGTAGDARFIPESVETTVIEESYTASVGEETDSVGLSLTIKVTGIAIANSTIDELGEILLSSQVPEGFKLKNENIEASFEFIDEVDDGIYDFDVNLIARLLPEVNIDEIIDQIKGKYPPDAESQLSEISGFTKAEVSLSPRFPGKLGIIPRIDKNISIEVVAER